MTDREVEFERLRPRQIAAEIKEVPVAYLPIGILEWHSFHNPYGLDGLKAKGLACRLAEELGGLVMPIMYWGDNRAEICEVHLDKNLSQLPEVDPAAPDYIPADIICETLQVTRDVFQKDAKRSRAHGGWALFEQLLTHSLHQTETYGFQKIVIIPGHYPLFAPVRNAMEKYSQLGGQCQTWLLDDSQFAAAGKGDHAAEHETSLMIALDPATVKLEEADPDPTRLPVGCAAGRDPRRFANKETGSKAIENMILHVKEMLNME